ncbi:hypothetical protein [Rhizobium sp. Root1220]|uniref:hypothetical protein n=1 Tax=Rhizobium sp. Root1220 TaxID=1736432 RepID=UPI0006FC7AE8|nr:hypothetical protein [Rhizobium sp. Root1220]KQV79260.1 hypothetical protein ASC90_26445 [Rhizobium sp. Root1220]
MSDTPKYITSDQLQLVQQVLTDGGYSAQVWTASPPNVAAQTLITLIQDGMSDPIDLARELELRFGQAKKGSAALQRAVNQLADRGIFVQTASEGTISSRGTNESGMSRDGTT